MIFSDIHVHTTYCDGKNSAEETVLAALEKNFVSIGFSGHSYTSFDSGWCMSEEGTEKYLGEVLLLREKYKDRIDILLGTERDFFADPDSHAYDYVIGSSHYVRVGNTYLTVDESAAAQKYAADEFFGGDIYGFVAAYYRQEAQIIQKTGCDVIGHFDLITKYNENGKMFDEDSGRYKKTVYETLEQLIPSKPFFEINTGAMTRGYRSRPYPADFITDYVAEHGCGLVITSDCHRKEQLGGFFDETEKRLRARGINNIFVATKNGFRLAEEY
ncbi:MAG: histidinol-phosphatase HisJ family protein [Eubacteriales bacterium]|nr:histidinol-phosphatase HisJ family protein [Eubacteriales bacterium]